ncbi:MAG: LolA family protein [Bacteroidales bacterium]
MIALICFILCIQLSPDQNQDDAPRMYEEKAEEILEEAGKVLRSYESLYVSFIYEMEDDTGDSGEQMNATLYSRGDQYHMCIGDNYFISDGEVVWTFMEDVNEVHISLAEDTEGAMTPTSVLDNFREEFRSAWLREEPYNNQTVHIIDMTPEEPQAFFKYRVAINKETHQLEYTQAYDRHGGIYRYAIETLEPNPEIPEGTFSFDPSAYPEIEVIDLR